MRKIRFEDKFIKLLPCEFGDNQSIFDVGSPIKTKYLGLNSLMSSEIPEGKPILVPSASKFSVLLIYN